MEAGISIIVCCYNSADRLTNTIKYLANQNLLNLNWQVIIVDNNSSDNTSHVAIQEWEKYGAPTTLTVVSEPTPGLSYARKAGIRNSKYNFILFCDDDNWLEPDYIQTASEIMLSDINIGILGGLNTPVSDVEIPRWFNEFRDSYACGPQAKQDGPVDPSRLYITGAGMVVRRKIFDELDRISFESQLIDRKGDELSSGGDTELCFMTAILGYKLVYSSKLKLFHYMDAKRLTWSYLVKLIQGHAKSYYKLLFYKKIFNKEKLNNTWFSDTIARVKKINMRSFIIMIYNYWFMRDDVVKDRFHIDNIFEAEEWKAHFKNYSSYKELINFMRRLDKNMRQIKLEK